MLTGVARDPGKGVVAICPTTDRNSVQLEVCATIIEERKPATGGILEGAPRTAPANPAAPAAARMPPTATRQDVYVEKLNAIPQFASFGPLFKSSSQLELTEAETEYGVRCVKHTYANHVVLQVTNATFF